MNSFTLEPTFHRYPFIVQPKHGFRFSVDSVILGHVIRSVNVYSVLELGAGSGIVSLSMFSHGVGRKFWLVEKNLQMCEALEMTITLNNLEDVFHPICDDIENILYGFEKVDTVIFNPPFYISGSARGNMAQIGEPTKFLEVASYAVKDDGVIAYIISTQSLPVMIQMEALLHLHPVYVMKIISDKGIIREVRVLSKGGLRPVYEEWVHVRDNKIRSFYTDGGI